MIIKIPEQVNTALTILTDAGYESYVVGGAVRDSVMGKIPDDWDVTTSALPEKIKECFAGYHIIETGIRHGTVTVRINHYSVEITTFRIDEGYSDNRHPDSVRFTEDVVKDLSRRDFSVNAIAYNPVCGFIDPFDGLNDIKRKLIKCVGDPDKRFNEDGLRILRGMRFSCSLGFDIDKETAISIHKNKNLLKNISRERIYSELCKMLPEADSKFLMEYEDLIFLIIPELSAEKGCAQNHERHIYDVWHHSCVAVENSPADPEIRIAALLHDIGKPECKTTDENGTDHFYGHEKVGAEITGSVMSSFKTSNAARRHVMNLVEYHGFVPELMSKKTLRKYIGRLGEECVRELFELRNADILAQNPKFIKEGLKNNNTGLSAFCSLIAEDSCFGIKDLKISGKDLKECGIDPSPLMGKILNILFEEVISDKLSNEENALLKRAKELYSDGNSKD